MGVHQKARLTPYRELPVQQVLAGRPVRPAAAGGRERREHGWRTAGRYQAEGPPGLLDRSRRRQCKLRARVHKLVLAALTSQRLRVALVSIAT